jgi:hypothetical protein
VHSFDLDGQQGGLVVYGRAGIVEHGLFIGLVSDMIVAGDNGCRYLSRKLA